MEKLLSGAKTLGLRLTIEQIDAFATYYQELKNWNERANLTAIVDCEEVQVKHFVDSLSILNSHHIVDLLKTKYPHVFENTGPNDLSSSESASPLALIDVGTGAGFPGIPLRILFPNLELTLLESITKKTAFLAHIVQVLNLQNVTILNGRAEEFGRKPRYREQFDIVTARAVAILPTLAEYALPFCRVGGLFVAFKKADIAEELASAEKAILILGGEIVEKINVTLPAIEGQRMLVVVKKAMPTPIKYPRRPDQPMKHPL